LSSLVPFWESAQNTLFIGLRGKIRFSKDLAALTDNRRQQAGLGRVSPYTFAGNGGARDEVTWNCDDVGTNRSASAIGTLRPSQENYPTDRGQASLNRNIRISLSFTLSNEKQIESMTRTSVLMKGACYGKKAAAFPTIDADRLIFWICVFAISAKELLALGSRDP
jgi:hypothetical protein